jgi:hypothetical protein
LHRDIVSQGNNGRLALIGELSSAPSQLALQIGYDALGSG